MSEWHSKNLENAIVVLRTPDVGEGGANCFDDGDLSLLSKYVIKADDEIADLTLEVNRLHEALQHIADGNLSPCIAFARFVLEGDSVDVAHKKQCVIWDRSD